MDTHRAHVTIDHAKCISCAELLCVGVCPVGILEEGENGKPAVSDETACTQCGICANLCPVQAITVNKEPKPDSGDPSEGV